MSKFLLILLFFSFAFAKTVWVSNKGSNTNGNGTEFNPYQTVRYAVPLADSGDTIRMKAGSYGYTTVNTSKILYFQGQSTTLTLYTGQIYYNTPEGTEFTGTMFSEMQFVSKARMLYFANPTTFNNVIWEKIAFYLDGDITDPDALVNLKNIKVTGENGFKINSVVFSTSAFKNPYNAIFNFDINGGPFYLSNIFVTGYDTTSKHSSQVMITGNTESLTISRSRTSGGGNFYIKNAKNVYIHGTQFYDASLALDSCQTVSLTSNSFINSGKYTIYSPNEDNLEHTGGIAILGTEKNAIVKDIQIMKNKFIGIVRTSCILVNRWNGEPTSETFKNVELSDNDFSQIEQNYDEVYAVNLNFSKVKINANYNYWGSKYGPRKCRIDLKDCKSTEKQKIRARGNVEAEYWYCSSEMKNDVDDGNKCPTSTPTATPTPTPTPSTKPKESGLTKGEKWAIGITVPVGAILIIGGIVVLIMINKKKKVKGSSTGGSPPKGWKKISGNQSSSNESDESALLDSELTDSDLD
ncbi:pectate lyase (eurofung) [Anaeramoeba flamelloides]|uniref:Pectate lyase (Eurofung) n=1 Tax=Anaeramoeba flamelloides TaxID=1746091 RepID=A0AAV7YX64_9EUKA|nr:pectate lyase (eurofung) [Anaeramoeba flamelloides]